MAELETPIARVIDAYQAAVAARDVGAFMRLYDPAARIFDAWGVWSYEGLDAWQVAVEGWLSTHPGDRFQVRFEDLDTVATPVFACVSAIVTYAVVSAQGAPLNALQNRLTWVLKPRGHALRIVHEHTSAPVGFEDQKAILVRRRTA